MPNYFKNLKNYFFPKKIINLELSESTRPSASDIDLKKPDYIALIDYKKQNADYINLSKNDLLILIRKTYPDYYYVKNVKTKKTGYVPSGFIIPINNFENEEYKNRSNLLFIQYIYKRD